MNRLASAHGGLRIAAAATAQRHAHPGLQRSSESVKYSWEVPGFGVDEEECDRGGWKRRNQIGGAEMAYRQLGQALNERRVGLPRRGVRRQAEDREAVLKTSGLMNFMVEDERERPLVHEVIRIDSRQINPRGQGLLLVSRFTTGSLASIGFIGRGWHPRPGPHRRLARKSLTLTKQDLSHLGSSGKFVNPGTLDSPGVFGV